VRITGAVAHATDLLIGDLQQLPRAERTADLNCVTTWCVRGVRWGGVPVRTFYEDVIVSRCPARLYACRFANVGVVDACSAASQHDERRCGRLTA
jgi:hypothetical protein